MECRADMPGNARDGGHLITSSFQLVERNSVIRLNYTAANCFLPMHNPLCMFDKATNQTVSGFGCLKKYMNQKL